MAALLIGWTGQARQLTMAGCAHPTLSGTAPDADSSRMMLFCCARRLSISASTAAWSAKGWPSFLRLEHQLQSERCVLEKQRLLGRASGRATAGAAYAQDRVNGAGCLGGIRAHTARDSGMHSYCWQPDKDAARALHEEHAMLGVGWRLLGRPRCAWRRRLDHSGLQRHQTHSIIQRVV